MNRANNAVPARPPRLSRSREFSVYGIAASVWLSGAGWLLLHYFLVTEDEFGATPNPLEPWFLALHGAASFASLWLFGLLWGVHVPAGWHARRRRLTGSILFSVFAFLSLSGYLLYYLGDELQREWTIFLHWAVGLGCPAAFLLHRFASDPGARDKA